MRIADSNAKAREQELSMKTLGADIVAAREDSRQLLSQAEKQGNDSDMALKD